MFRDTRGRTGADEEGGERRQVTKASCSPNIFGPTLIRLRWENGS